MKREVFNKFIIHAQRKELTEKYIYDDLKKLTKDNYNKKILEYISKNNLKHSNIWKKYTQIVVKPYKLRILKHKILSRLFGLVFSIQLMEKEEKRLKIFYDEYRNKIPEMNKIEKDELTHQKNLIKVIKEEKLTYIGSIVLGLEDSLVEMTGTLAGLTIALGNSKLIGIAGLITGIAASLSLAASEYLSSKTEETRKKPITAATFTGLTFITVVTLLIWPYLILKNVFLSLAITICSAIILIILFSYYISITKAVSFNKKFLEMGTISLVITALSFLIGLLVNYINP